MIQFFPCAHILLKPQGQVRILSTFYYHFITGVSNPNCINSPEIGPLINIRNCLIYLQFEMELRNRQSMVTVEHVEGKINPLKL